MQTLILAGGLGTRLRGIVRDIPKVMVDIKGKPFLEYLIVQLKNYNLNDIILCTGHLKEKIENYFGNGNHLGVNIVYSEEPKPLGTGGAIKLAENLVKSNDFIVMNGDSFFDIDLYKLINYHLNKKALVAARYVKGDICNYHNLEANPNGSVENIAGITDETGRLIGMMPHPERAIDFTHLPNWTLLKEQSKRAGREIPNESLGLKIFQNAVKYFK